MYVSKLYASARKRAEKYGREFSITKEWYKNKLEATTRCELSGLPLARSKGKGGGRLSPSLDRIDSSKGYAPENCRIVAFQVNCALGKFGDGPFLEMCRAVVRRHNRRVN